MIYFFHGPVILPYISNSIWWITTILCNNESQWCDLWPNNVGHSNIFFMVQWFCLLENESCNITFDLKINLGQSDLYFMVQWFFFFFFGSEKHFSFIDKAQFRWPMLSCNSSYFSYSPLNFVTSSSVTKSCLWLTWKLLKISSWNFIQILSIIRQRAEHKNHNSYCIVLKLFPFKHL